MHIKEQANVCDWYVVSHIWKQCRRQIGVEGAAALPSFMVKRYRCFPKKSAKYKNLFNPSLKAPLQK